MQRLEVCLPTTGRFKKFWMLCVLSVLPQQSAFLTSFTAFLELPLKWGWLFIVFLSGLTLFMMSGVIMISDACFQDLRPAMCSLFYQVKNAHPHALIALAYHWLTHTRKHSALRYNIDKTLLDYQINQLGMILHLKYGWSSFIALQTIANNSNLHPEINPYICESIARFLGKNPPPASSKFKINFWFRCFKDYKFVC